MSLPRLTPSANSFTLSEKIINKKLRPYFENWYNKEKEAVESPDDFVSRILKALALNSHIQDNIKTETDAIEAQTAASNQAINDDVTSLSGEVD